jgi:hypothetical protein
MGDIIEANSGEKWACFPVSFNDIFNISESNLLAYIRYIGDPACGRGGEFFENLRPESETRPVAKANEGSSK